uniref:Uncharacterized protein n=1 Tax=Ditylenchus dipsaci TaxID=166011 RepID=A0A915DLZ5_9BILA
MDQGNNRLIPHRSFYHPSRLRDRHILLRSKTTATKIDTCKNGQPKNEELRDLKNKQPCLSCIELKSITRTLSDYPLHQRVTCFTIAFNSI